MVAVSLKKFFFQAEDGIRDLRPSRGLGDVYKRQEGESVCVFVTLHMCVSVFVTLHVCVILHNVCVCTILHVCVLGCKRGSP